MQEEDNDDDEQLQRLPGTIFATIGIPYCLVFGIMAHVLQFNPNIKLQWSNELQPNDATTAATNPNLDFVTESAAAALDQQQADQLWTRMGYVWCAAIESFGSLQVATFWSYSISTLSLTDAEHFYGLVIR
jgi:hypothetical protein